MMNELLLSADEVTISKAAYKRSKSFKNIGRIILSIEGPDQEDIWNWLLEEWGKQEILNRLGEK